MLSTRTILPQEKTWGEALRRYDMIDRKKNAWEQMNESMPIVNRVSHLQKRSNYNPLLSRHFEAQTEMLLRDKEAAENAIRATRMQKKCENYNIVNHHSTKKSPEFRNRGNVRKSSSLNDKYDIINGQKHSYPTKESEPQCEIEEDMRRRKKVFDGERDKEQYMYQKQRLYNIVSNKYRDEHERKIENERMHAKQKAQEQFWKSHDFDPLLVRYYDERKEKEYQRQRNTLAQIAGTALQASLPPTIQYAEGESYNILSHSIKDQAKLNIVCGIGNRSVTGKSLGPRVEKNLKSKHENASIQSQARSLNRLARTHHLRQRDSGVHRNYDLISHLAKSKVMSTNTNNVLFEHRPESNLANLQRTAPLLFSSSHQTPPDLSGVTSSDSGK